MSKTVEDQGYMGVGALARKFGALHESTVRRWIKEGRLRAIKVGARVLVPKEEVDRFIREGEGKTAPVAAPGLVRTMGETFVELRKSDDPAARALVGRMRIGRIKALSPCFRSGRPELRPEPRDADRNQAAHSVGAG